MSTNGDQGSVPSTAEGSPPQALVLIGFADALAAPEVVFSLCDAGFPVAAFARAGAPKPAIARLPIAALVTLPPPELDAAATISSLRAAVEKMAPAAILPLDDAALWLVDKAFGEMAEGRK